MANRPSIPISLTVAAAITAGLGLASAPARAEPVSFADSIFSEALEAYERNHWQLAFQALADLADAGHAQAARWAWLMVRHGHALYHGEFASDPGRSQRWLALASGLAANPPLRLSAAPQPEPEEQP